MILDFLKNRRLLVDIDGTVTEPVDLAVGCVQGSTLGPRLFTLYCGDLASELGCNHFISYADDSYVVIKGDTLEEVKSKIKAVSTRHIKKLNKLGMKVNESKSEAVIFGKKAQSGIDINIGDVVIKTTEVMKVLGITFDSKLSWEAHISCLLKKCNSKLAVLKKLRHKFTLEQFKKIITSQYFSVLYYCSPVWLHDNLKSGLKRQINSAHFKALHILLKDYRNKISRSKLTKKCGRATPNQWYKYSVANLVIKTFNQDSPSYLSKIIRSAIYNTRRKPLIGRFFDNSKGKIGKQSLESRLNLMDAVKFDCIGKEMTDDRLRKLLKQTYFDY